MKAIHNALPSLSKYFKVGNLRIYDPQVGNIFKWNELLKYISFKDGIDVLRVDNKLVNESLVNKMVKILK